MSYLQIYYWHLLLPFTPISSVSPPSELLTKDEERYVFNARLFWYLGDVLGTFNLLRDTQNRML